MRLYILDICKFPENDPILLIWILGIRLTVMNIYQSRCEKRPRDIVNTVDKSHWPVLSWNPCNEIEKHLKTSLRRVSLCVSIELVLHCLIKRRRLLQYFWRRRQLFLMLWKCRCNCSTLISNTLDSFLLWWWWLCLYIVGRLLELILLSWSELFILIVWQGIVWFRLWLFILLLFVHEFFGHGLCSHLNLSFEE